ncbi:MAG TPA: helix-turn-helix transcriptional regulator [Planctomycetota bacterium]|nr:helix-turn-helix transcriptional regulator [Planctomycetota bacterium]
MDANKAVRDLCARIFREPQRLQGVFARRLDAPLYLPLHQHASIVQLDLISGCSGGWLGGSRPAIGTSAAVFYPRVKHGYDLVPRQRGACLFSIKLRVESGWPAVRHRLFAAYVPGISGEAALVKALWRLGRLAEHRTQSALLPAALAEVLALWPQDSGSENSSREPLLNDAAVLDALKFIDANATKDVTVEEIADAVHLSPRQLNRRMRANLGCSPQQAIHARRIGHARTLLARADASITEVAEMMGFASIHTFSRWFRKSTGVAPSAWREEPL